MYVPKLIWMDVIIFTKKNISRSCLGKSMMYQLWYNTLYKQVKGYLGSHFVKTQMSFFFWSHVVHRPSVCVSVNFSQFGPLQSHLISTKPCTKQHWTKGIHFFPNVFPNGDTGVIAKWYKYINHFLKISWTNFNRHWHKATFWFVQVKDHAIK